MIAAIPCPFCTWQPCYPDEVEIRVWAVCCPNCKTIGPESQGSRERAVEYWNKRGDEIKAARSEAYRECAALCAGLAAKNGRDGIWGLSRAKALDEASELILTVMEAA